MIFLSAGIETQTIDPVSCEQPRITFICKALDVHLQQDMLADVVEATTRVRGSEYISRGLLIRAVANKDPTIGRRNLIRSVSQACKIQNLSSRIYGTGDFAGHPVLEAFCEAQVIFFRQYRIFFQIFTEMLSEASVLPAITTRSQVQSQLRDVPSFAPYQSFTPIVFSTTSYLIIWLETSSNFPEMALCVNSVFSKLDVEKAAAFQENQFFVHWRLIKAQ